MFQDDIRSQLAGDASGAAALGFSPGPDPSAPRVAVYGDDGSAPSILSVDDARLPDLIDILAQRVFDLAQSKGGTVPYTAVRSVVENLLHAGFVDVVITILADGSTIRVADGGPGIPDKVGALRPGFTTAGPAERRHIPGVGAGLGLAQAALEAVDGHLEIDDNLGRGTVVTLTAPPAQRPPRTTTYRQASTWMAGDSVCSCSYSRSARSARPVCPRSWGYRLRPPIARCDGSSATGSSSPTPRDYGRSHRRGCGTSRRYYKV